MDNDEVRQNRKSLTNYVVYQELQNTRTRIGHYDLSNKTIQPLSFISGTPIDNLYQVIEVGDFNIISQGDRVSASSVKILPPLKERDVLCVGKNYAEHAKEFNSSGFDSSDKVDQPSHPVIFTKRFTSIIADGEDIDPHPEFTQTADYEGEIGVIIGKPGFRVSEANAMSHVWGYTIINDMTARERQRDHKQFYIGKSADTFCPMGPIAVPASNIGDVLRVQTHVNGELRQDATTDNLIFSIPFLIKTMSEGQTLMPGDVIATGTPAGVGIGRKPPAYLQPGDTVAVSVTGLGTLTNRIADSRTLNPTVERVQAMTHLRMNNYGTVPEVTFLTPINNKQLHYRRLGQARESHSIVLVHGLGGSMEMFLPLIQTLKLEQKYCIHLFDLEGHGLSPTSPLSKLSIESFAEDLYGVIEHVNISSSVTIIAHSMGCLIAAQCASSHPSSIRKLIFIDIPSASLDLIQRKDLMVRADTARNHGMLPIANEVAHYETSLQTKTSNPLAVAAVRMSLLSQDPEGYAKACTALADAQPPNMENINMEIALIVGGEDLQYPDWIPIMDKTSIHFSGSAGCWHVLEELQGVATAMGKFLD